MMERNEKKVNKKLNRSIEMVNQVDGTEAEVDPRLGDFKDQFMLPVGSVIPKYLPDLWTHLMALCPIFRKERQARVKKHGHLNLTEEELAKIKAGKAKQMEKMRQQVSSK